MSRAKYRPPTRVEIIEEARVLFSKVLNDNIAETLKFQIAAWFLTNNLPRTFEDMDRKAQRRSKTSERNRQSSLNRYYRLKAEKKAQKAAAEEGESKP